jgi:predicted small lipoprotein YifL
MLPRTKLSLLALLPLTAAACGLKGPLYRPDGAKTESATPAQPAQTPKKKDSSNSAPAGEQPEPPVATPDPDRPAVPPGR